VGPIPGLAFWALGAVVLGEFWFRHTRFGAHVVATGDKRERRACRASASTASDSRFS
jgi:ribose/xylose/arabinose/galactoside ABC-type transport system permease subunit